MAKICTSLEQSKKLIELGIDVNTADIWYQYIGDSFKDGITKPLYFPMVMRDNPTEKDIPAWSLIALLELMPIETHLYKMQDEDNYTKHYYKVGSFDGKGWIELNNTLSIDAAFDMVCWLLENNKL